MFAATRPDRFSTSRFVPSEDIFCRYGGKSDCQNRQIDRQKALVIVLGDVDLARWGVVNVFHLATVVMAGQEGYNW